MFRCLHNGSQIADGPIATLCSFSPEDQDAGKLRITSSSVYNTIMMFMLREAEGIFRKHLGMQSPAAAAAGGDEHGALRPIKETDLTKNGRWVRRWMVRRGEAGVERAGVRGRGRGHLGTQSGGPRGRG